MSAIEVDETPTRIASTIDFIERSNPSINQQLMVAVGTFNAIKEKALNMISEQESDLATLKQNINEILA